HLPPSLYTAPSTTHPPTLSLHDALPISGTRRPPPRARTGGRAASRAGPAWGAWRPAPATGAAARPSASASPSRTASRPRRRGCRSEEHTSELQSRFDLVCRLLLEKKKER